MDNSEELDWAVGENLMEVSWLLQDTIVLLSAYDRGSNKQKLILQKDMLEIISYIESRLLSQLWGRYPRMNMIASLRIKTQEPEKAPGELKGGIAHCLQFADEVIAILMRQTILNVRSLLNRSCAIYVQQDIVPDDEKRLLRRRIGRIFGSEAADILDDLFIANPGFAISGFEEFDWQRARDNRDKKG